jgi:hypothetical protein
MNSSSLARSCSAGPLAEPDVPPRGLAQAKSLPGHPLRPGRRPLFTLLYLGGPRPGGGFTGGRAERPALPGVARDAVGGGGLGVRPDLGDAGELLDARAKAAYRARLGELAAELEEAQRWNDPGCASTAAAERDFLLGELARAVGLGGRDRRAASHAERARLNVTRAIRAAMANLACANPSWAAAGGHGPHRPVLLLHSRPARPGHLGTLTGGGCRRTVEQWCTGVERHPPMGDPRRKEASWPAKGTVRSGRRADPHLDSQHAPALPDGGDQGERPAALRRVAGAAQAISELAAAQTPARGEQTGRFARAPRSA